MSAPPRADDSDDDIDLDTQELAGNNEPGEPLGLGPGEWISSAPLKAARTERTGSESPLAVTHACFKAYLDKNLAAIDALLAEDFHFTSPFDNTLDRAAYFERCWPGSAVMAQVDFIYQVEEGTRAYVVYEAQTTSGKRFRNCEVHTVRNGKLLSTEVYFGWDLPHQAPVGGFIDNDSHGQAPAR